MTFTPGLGRAPKYYVGQETEFKKIVSAAGKDKVNGALLFNWICNLCGKEYGPSTGTAIFKSTRTRCCPLTKSEKRNYRGYDFISGKKMTDWRQNARKRGRTFEVDAKYLVELWNEQGGMCWYSGLPMEYGVNASLDRTDSEIGYVVGNVKWVHIDVNWMKRNFKEDEFIKFCHLISQRHSV